MGVLSRILKDGSLGSVSRSNFLGIRAAEDCHNCEGDGFPVSAEIAHASPLADHLVSNCRSTGLMK